MANKTFNNVKINTEFTAATTRANIKSGENISTSFGKIAKWYTDFHNCAFSGNAAKVNNHTVAADVPSNAKFTDTTYTNASLGQGYGTCTTAATTVAKIVTLANYSLIIGGIVSVKFTYTVPANATMNINSKGAKA